MGYLKPPTIAIILPCFNEEDCIDSSTSTMKRILEELIAKKNIAENSYLYFVDDGSTDNTWLKIFQLYQQVSFIKATKLSRNFGHQAALLSGLSAVTNRCDAAISIDIDLQQDPNVIKQFVQAFLEGNEIVFGVRLDRTKDSWFKRKSAEFFYHFSSLMGLHIIPNHADCRLLSNAALIALETHTEPNVFLRALCLNLGFKTSQVYFHVQERQFGVSKYTISKMFNLAIQGITSFSVTPLRFVAAIGFIIFMLSICMSIYVLWSAMITGKVVSGWASTVIPIYFIGGIQLLSLGIIGEYIGQIYMTVKRRPRWISEKTLD